MKKLILLALVLCSAATMLAQTNRMSYQAVVRNAANELVAEENLTVAIRISDANGTSVYSETHSVTSNRNGVISLMIGEGSGQSGNMTAVDWRTAQIHTMITLPGGATLPNTVPVNAVPYAFYADSVDVQWVSDVVDEYLENHSISSIVETDPTVPDWAKEANKPAYDYSEIANTPQIPQIPADVSAFNNDAGYITAADIPAIPTVPTDVSAFNNDAGYITAAEVPAVTVPTNVSDFTNDAGYITAADIPAIPNNVSTFVNDANYITNADIPTNVSAFTNDANYITAADIPAIPTVPTDVSAFNNDAGYITAAEVPAVTVPTNVSAFDNDANYITAADIPAIPTVPTDVSAFNNDAGYITAAEVPAVTVPTNVSAFDNDAGYITGYTETQTLANVTALGNSAGNRQLKDVSDPTEFYDAVNLRTLNMLMDSIRAQFHQMQQQIDSLEDRIDELGNNSAPTQPDTTTLVDGQPCPGTPTVTDCDGNVYNTVQIGDQCWTKTNLRSTKTADGTPLTDGAASLARSNTEPYYYVPTTALWNVNNSSVTYDATTFGYYYNWQAAKLVCPAGWHLPSDMEWTTLSHYVSGKIEYTCGYNSANNAKALAATEGWNTHSGTCAVGNDLSANNATGFSAVPAGVWDDGFWAAGYQSIFWSSTDDDEFGPNQPWYRYLNCESAYVNRYTNLAFPGYSVRCLRDNDVPPTTYVQPTATTSAATNITSTSATLNGNVSNPDNVTITAQGFEWKTTTGGTYTAVNATGETMTYNLTDLTAGTAYTYRAFVTTAEGTAYGSEMDFTTTAASGTVVIDAKSCPGTPTVTDHEGNVYATVQIGTQCWMRENLRTTTSPKTGTYLVNTAGLTGNSASTLDGSKVAHWCMNDSATYAPKGYGLFYNWCAVMDTANPSGYVEVPTASSENNNSFTFNPSGKHRGICPEGWHVPTDAEWSTMEAVVNGSDVSSLTGYRGSHAGKLAGGNDWDSTSTANAPGNYSSTARNSTGFTVVPAGFFYTTFNQSRVAAIFWTSSQRSAAYKAWGRYFRYENGGVGRYTNTYHGQGRSVRCLKD